MGLEGGGEAYPPRDAASRRSLDYSGQSLEGSEPVPRRMLEVVQV